MDRIAADEPGTRASGSETKPEREGSDRKRGQIVEGARAVFLAHGFDGASMGAVARSAGVSKGTLYVYFASKEALFAALLREQHGKSAEVLFEIDPGDVGVDVALKRLGESFLEHVLDPDHLALVRVTIAASEKFPAVGRSFFEAGPACGVDRLTAYLQSQVSAGRLVIGDVGLAAFQFLGMCQTPVLMPVLFGNEAPGRERRSAVVDGAARTFLAAYAVPG
jgi:AcrR family transcriptional regulator